MGYLGVYAGTSLEWAEEVVDLIVREMGRLAAGEIGEEELQRAKSQLVGNMILGLESTDSWMSHITRNEIYFGKAISVEEISSGVRSVSRADIVDLARATFRSEEMALSLLGDFEKKSLDLSLSI